MAGKGPTVQDRAEAIRRLLFGLARGDDVPGLAAAIEELHPRHDTFPGEVFMRLSADALDVAGVGQDDPLPCTALRENYLGEFKFQGRGNRKIQFGILASASARGGIQPDLLDEVAWWQADDFWWYALAAAVAVIRACADRMSLSVPAFVQQLSALREDCPAVSIGRDERGRTWKLSSPPMGPSSPTTVPAMALRLLSALARSAPARRSSHPAASGSASPLSPTTVAVVVIAATPSRSRRSGSTTTLPRLL